MRFSILAGHLHLLIDLRLLADQRLGLILVFRDALFQLVALLLDLRLLRTEVGKLRFDLGRAGRMDHDDQRGGHQRKQDHRRKDNGNDSHDFCSTGSHNFLLPSGLRQPI